MYIEDASIQKVQYEAHLMLFRLIEALSTYSLAIDLPFDEVLVVLTFLRCLARSQRL